MQGRWNSKRRMVGAVALSAGLVLPGARGVLADLSIAPVAGVSGPAATPVTKVLGPGSPSNTDTLYNVYGADLGSMFESGGKVYMVFGDTFGRPTPGQRQAQPSPRDDLPTQIEDIVLDNADWRSNTMAYFADADPRIGPIFDGMITDAPLHAKELLSSLAVKYVEDTVIPTYGTAVGNRLFLDYMSVNHYGPGGNQWTINYSGMAYSDDGGQNWTKDANTRWSGTSNFGQVAILPTSRYQYLFGIPGGRDGGVKLARVHSDSILNKDAYRYWTGSSWAQDENAAAYLAAASGGQISSNVGELSVRWNSYYRKWLMMYLDPRDPNPSIDGGAIVVRSAQCLTGPWSDEREVANQGQYPASYAPMMPPRWNEGPDVYFTLSDTLPYSPYWMHTRLDGEPLGNGAQCTWGPHTAELDDDTSPVSPLPLPLPSLPAT